MNLVDKQYLDLAKEILENGEIKEDRTGVGTRSIFGTQTRYDLTKGFPILTTKKVPFGLIKSELLWFLSGNTNIKFLLENNNHIWDEWAFQKLIDKQNIFKEKYQEWYPDNQENITTFLLDSKTHGLNYRFKNEKYNSIYIKAIKAFGEEILKNDEFAKEFGELGPVYGKQWRDFSGIDQIKNVINEIKTNPSSRRLIVSAWNPKDIPEMALPPCHLLFQFYVNNNQLSCHLYQRSGDYFLGVPFNISSYSLLTYLIAHETGLIPKEFIHTISDTHLYLNHTKQIITQLNRPTHELPQLILNQNKKSIFDFSMEDIELDNYISEKPIKAPVAI